MKAGVFCLASSAETRLRAGCARQRRTDGFGPAGCAKRTPSSMIEGDRPEYLSCGTSGRPPPRPTSTGMPGRFFFPVNNGASAAAAKAAQPDNPAAR